MTIYWDKALLDRIVRKPDTEVGRVTVGGRNVIHPEAVIGTPAQHRTELGLGDIIIGNNNVIREFATIQRPTQKLTKIGDNCYLMTGAHVSHDTILEDNVTLTNFVSLAGFTYLCNGVTIGLNSTTHQYTTIGAYTMVGMLTPIVKDIPPFLKVAGNPMRVLGINEVGLERAGFSEFDIAQVKQYYTTRELPEHPDLCKMIECYEFNKRLCREGREVSFSDIQEAISD